MKWIISVLMVVLMISTVSAAPQNAMQDPNSGGGCGGGGIIVCPAGYEHCASGCCLIPAITVNTQREGSSHFWGSGVSMKRHWIEIGRKGCTMISIYETYRVGVCLPGELRCEIKQYPERVRYSLLPDCHYYD